LRGQTEGDGCGEGGGGFQRGAAVEGRHGSIDHAGRIASIAIPSGRR
jgi:hypothetical protein